MHLVINVTPIVLIGWSGVWIPRSFFVLELRFSRRYAYIRENATPEQKFHVKKNKNILIIKGDLILQNGYRK